MATTAADFAMAGNLAAMHTLLELHPYCLLPAALGLLNSVPETVPPKAFGPSLRLLVALQSPPAVARPKDWIESEQMCIALRRRGEHRLLLCTEQMCKLNLGWAPPSESQVASWAQHRAVAVDKATGQLQWAVELLDVAKAALCYGPASQALGDIHRQAQALTLLLQLAAKRDGGEKWRTDLATFTALDTVDKLRLLFRYVDSGDDMASDIRRVVVPFASLLASDAQQQGSSETFIKALEAEADEQLPWVARFLQCEAERPEALGTAADVARAACAVTYASPSTEAWAFQEAILGATGEALASAPGVEPLQAESLRRAVDQARGHLTAARMLTRHGLPTPVATVRDATHEDAARLVRTLLARAARARTPESRWADLWTDLQVVLEQGLRAVPVDEARQELCRALLGCGQMRAAKKHLDRLPPEKQEEVVLTTARDLFYSEGAPDAAAVKRAKEALAVLPGNRAAEEEASFIDAAAKLKALGVDMPPLQLRQAPDKAMLLRQALESAPAKSLRDVDGLVALSGALGTGLSQDQVLALVAEVALAAAEVRLAEGVAMQLASKRSR